MTRDALLEACRQALRRVRGVQAGMEGMIVVQGRESLVQLGAIYEDLAHALDGAPEDSEFEP